MHDDGHARALEEDAVIAKRDCTSLSHQQQQHSDRNSFDAAALSAVIAAADSNTSLMLVASRDFAAAKTPLA